jgi:hypothetical protein
MHRESRRTTHLPPPWFYDPCYQVLLLSDLVPPAVGQRNRLTGFQKKRAAPSGRAQVKQASGTLNTLLLGSLSGCGSVSCGCHLDCLYHLSP